MKPSFQYSCKLSRVIDGDTVELLVDLGFNVWKKVHLRLDGVNCEELNDLDEVKRNRAACAADYLTYLLDIEDRCVVKTKFIRSFARYVGTIYLPDGECVNELMQGF